MAALPLLKWRTSVARGAVAPNLEIAWPSQYNSNYLREIQ